MAAATEEAPSTSTSPSAPSPEAPALAAARARVIVVSTRHLLAPSKLAAARPTRRGDGREARRERDVALHRVTWRREGVRYRLSSSHSTAPSSSLQRRPRHRRRSAAPVIVVTTPFPSSSSSQLPPPQQPRRQGGKAAKRRGGQPRRCSAKAKVKAAGQLVACGSLGVCPAVIKGPYERGGGGDGDQAAKGCMDAAATGAKTGSTLSSGCCAAKAPAWMEFSGDSTLCKKKDNTLDEVKEVVHVKQDAPPPSSFLPNSSVCTYKLHYLSTTCAQVRTIAQVIIVVHAITQGLQSLFVKACGVNISVQVDLSNTKVDYLINSACQKTRILEYNKSLSDYPLYRNSTIEIRFRGRAGQPMTFDEKFDDIHANTWFYTVDLVPALQRQTRTNPPVLPWLSVRYFSDFASYNIQKVLNHITAMHRENLSYNGAFNSDNIIFHNGAVTIQGVLTVQFNGVTCAKDFAKLYSIFIAKFTPHERMSQLEHLDNIYPRHPGHSTTNISALGTFSWQDKVVKVPELRRAFIYGPNGRAYLVNGVWHNLNPLYTNDPKGCLHFANNFLKHAQNRINRQETRLERFRDRKLDSEMKQQSGGAVNESYLARLMEASWWDGGMLEYKEKQP
uniref:Uncharacterized protein n=1 Tax=Oryza barthii TaxID=65489 RepID=A0A0D3EKC9_9ORYZ